MKSTQSVLQYLRAQPIMGSWTKLNCGGVGLRLYFISVNHQIKTVCEVEHEGWRWVTSESGACWVSHSFLLHSPRDCTPAQHEEAMSLKDMAQAHTKTSFSPFHTHTAHSCECNSLHYISPLCAIALKHGCFDLTRSMDMISAKCFVPCPSSMNCISSTRGQWCEFLLVLFF